MQLNPEMDPKCPRSCDVNIPFVCMYQGSRDYTVPIWDMGILLFNSCDFNLANERSCDYQFPPMIRTLYKPCSIRNATWTCSTKAYQVCENIKPGSECWGNFRSRRPVADDFFFQMNQITTRSASFWTMFHPKFYISQNIRVLFFMYLNHVEYWKLYKQTCSMLNSIIINQKIQYYFLY